MEKVSIRDHKTEKDVLETQLLKLGNEVPRVDLNELEIYQIMSLTPSTIILFGVSRKTYFTYRWTFI